MQFPFCCSIGFSPPSFLGGEGGGEAGGEGHHFSPARQYVPNEIHLFKTLYIITLSGLQEGPRVSLCVCSRFVGPRRARGHWSPAPSLRGALTIAFCAPALPPHPHRITPILVQPFGLRSFPFPNAHLPLQAQSCSPQLLEAFLPAPGGNVGPPQTELSASPS